MEKTNYIGIEMLGIILIGIIFSLFIIPRIFAVDPAGPDTITVSDNETKSAVSAKIINISGGRIATMNINATIQNPRWKAFVGNVTGKFTLMDQTGSQIFDWSLSTVTGRVYATRNSTSVSWGTINCSNVTFLESENQNMNHTNADDNITKTFNTTAGATHDGFFVGTRYMTSNTCPTLNTYVNNATQDTKFEEVALYDGFNTVFATILESDQGGFDSNTYDFQMIVPEIGLPGYSGATAYYLYVELGN
jgi:hypothetical protein